MTRAAGDVLATVPRNVPGSSSLATVPPGEWFSNSPVPADSTGATLNRKSGRYCGTATSQRANPAIAAPASIRQRRPHSTSKPTGACRSLIATPAPSAAPAHQRSPRTHPRSQIPLRASSTRLICPSSMLAATGSKAMATSTSRTVDCQSLTPTARSVVIRNTTSDSCRIASTTISCVVALACRSGCSIQATGSGVTYWGPATVSLVAAERSYGL